jgi:hypothetical protein
VTAGSGTTTFGAQALTPTITITLAKRAKPTRRRVSSGRCGGRLGGRIDDSL